MITGNAYRQQISDIEIIEPINIDTLIDKLVTMRQAWGRIKSRYGPPEPSIISQVSRDPAILHADECGT